MATDTLHCFPNDDATFRSAAESLFELFGQYDPRVLQRSLREMYPLAVVRRQQSLASVDGRKRVWYVYRDGHYVVPGERVMQHAMPIDGA
jgi:hypothetical protein